MAGLCQTAFPYYASSLYSDHLTAVTSERAALEGMRAGDPSGLAALYDLHATAVYSLALRIVSTPADAEDVTQEVFAQAWKTRARYDESRGEVVAWLLMMARSRALDCLRRGQRRRTTDVDDAGLAAIPHPGPSVEYTAATEEQAARARIALDTLPSEQRKVLELAYFEGLTHVEIAARTSAPLGTVKTRIRSALSSLRSALTGNRDRVGGEA